MDRGAVAVVGFLVVQVGFHKFMKSGFCYTWSIKTEKFFEGGIKNGRNYSCYTW